MKKLIIPIGVVLLMSGCSYFTVNATMCDQIAQDPQAVMPQECRDYNKKEAEKAFNKVTNDKKVTDKDIQFSKEQE